MGRFVFADTSGLIAKFLERDENHAAAQREARRLSLEGRRFVTTNYVFDEVVTRTRRLAGFSWSRRVGEAILESKLIRRVFIDEAAEALAWGFYLKFSDQEISFTDAASFAVMRSHGLTEAFTFDRDFARAGFTMLPVGLSQA